jgi:hypothetical protein
LEHLCCGVEQWQLAWLITKRSPVQYKILDITEVIDHRKDGGRIVISTGAVDRDKDRVFPTRAKLANYLKNPVVLWGHNYYSADALIGRAKTIEVTETGIVADFELRPAATDVDPQNIVLLLWAQKFVHASSIGFRPEPGAMLQNEFGGIDFVTWELLEFSLVSVPANPMRCAWRRKPTPKRSRPSRSAAECSARRTSPKSSRRMTIWARAGADRWRRRRRQERRSGG